LKKQKDKGRKPGNEKKKDEQQDLKEESIPIGGAGDIVAEKSQSPPVINSGEDQSTAEGTEDHHGEPTDAVETQALHTTPSEKAHDRQSSLSLQSQLRSSTFRRTSVSQAPLSPLSEIKSPILPVLSPEGDSVNEIYRKQTLRLDELENENKRLAKEARDARLRWEKAEQELEDLHESNGEFAELRMRATKLDAQSEELIRLVWPFRCSIPL
jgi:DNA repair ATPase RecN